MPVVPCDFLKVHNEIRHRAKRMMKYENKK